MHEKPDVKLPVALIDSLAGAASLDEILVAAAEYLPRMVGAHRGSVALHANGRLEVRGFLGDNLFEGRNWFDIEHSFVGSVFTARRPVLIGDLSRIACVNLRKLVDAGFRSAIVVPLVSGDVCFGTVNMSHRDLGYFTPEHLEALSVIARFMASQIRIHNQMAEMHRIAHTDALTGASNRRAFLDHASELMRRFHHDAEPFAIVLLDLDRFKSINDRHGHMGGDIILRGVVEELTGNIRETDRLARIGGEEFAILLERTALTEAEWFAERFRGVVSGLARAHEGRRIACTTSIGVAAVRPSDAVIDDLLRRADAALYAAKQNGRNRVEIAA